MRNVHSGWCFFFSFIPFICFYLIFLFFIFFFINLILCRFSLNIERTWYHSFVLLVPLYWFQRRLRFLFRIFFNPFHFMRCFSEIFGSNNIQILTIGIFIWVHLIQPMIANTCVCCIVIFFGNRIKCVSNQLEFHWFCMLQFYCW